MNFALASRTESVIIMPQNATPEMIDQLACRLELSLGSLEKKRLLLYTKLLMQGLQKQRLTGERTAKGLIEKQIYDSLYPLQLITLKEAGKALDLGSGGGLPGVPIKICMTHLSMFLADANKRKIRFLQNAVEQLGLDKVNFINERAEVIGQNKEHRERFDHVFCRAVAEMAVLAELVLPLLKTGGRALIYKGPRGMQEAIEAEKAIKLCGGFIEKVHEYSLSTGEKRSLFILNKAESTPDQYPRSIGTPGRKPLKD